MNRLLCTILAGGILSSLAPAAPPSPKPVVTYTIQTSDTSVPVGTPVTITLALTSTDGVALSCGKVTLDYRVSRIDPNTSLPYWAIDWTTFADGTPTAGQFSGELDTSAMQPGDQVEVRGKYSAQECSSGYNVNPNDWTTASFTIDITAAACETPLTIAADLAEGPSPAQAGLTATWRYRIKVTACEAVDNVTAQGGTSGWTDYAGLLPSAPTTAALRKVNKRNEVVLWTIGHMDPGQEQTLLVTLNGTIKPNTPSGTVLFLSGPWSATYLPQTSATSVKSDYTGRVYITVQ